MTLRERALYLALVAAAAGAGGSALAKDREKDGDRDRERAKSRERDKSADADDEAAIKSGIGELYYPFSLSTRLLARFDAPATALLKVDHWGFAAYLRRDATDGSASAHGATSTMKTDGTSYGLTPVYVAQRGVRLALSYDSEESTQRNKIVTPGEDDGHSKGGLQVATIAAQAAVPIGHYAVGLKYGSTKLRLYDDQRGVDSNAGVVNGSEKIADLRLSGAYLTKQQEVHLELLPKIERTRRDVALRRPASLLVNYRRQLAPTQALLVDGDYELRGAFEGEANTFALRGGMALFEPGLPVLGGLVGYAHKSYAEATAAAPDTVAKLDLTLFVDYRSDAHTHYAASLDAAAGQGSGETGGGDSTKIKTQSLGYQASFIRSF